MSASECLQHPWLSGADIYIGKISIYTDMYKGDRGKAFQWKPSVMNCTNISYLIYTVDVEGLFGQLLVHMY